MDIARTPESDLPPAGAKWIRYLSAERRPLWAEIQGVPSAGLGDTDPVAAGFPDPATWDDAVDAAFSTRVPQCAFTTRAIGSGGPARFSLKAFPDFSPNGAFKGVIQVVERRLDRQSGDSVVHSDPEVHAVLDLTLCGVVLYDPARNLILSVNRRLAQETGYSKEELEGQGGETLWGAAGVQLIQAIFRRMSEAGSGMVWGQMLRLYGRNGVDEGYYCSFRLIPARPEHDAPPAILVSMDATETDAVSGTVRSGPNPRFVMDALQDGLWEYDATRGIVRYSAAFSDIFGPEGAPGGAGKAGREILEAIYPGESDQLQRGWRLLLKKGVPYRHFYRIRTPRGEWRWLLATIHAILNDGRGRPARILGFHMDISDAMQSSTELVDAEERLRVIFENAGSGIAVSTIAGPLARVNPALALMLGRNLEDFPGAWLSNFAHPGDKDALRGVLQRLLRGGRRDGIAGVRFLRPDGREVRADITATISRKVADGERYVIAMVEDVTASHAAREKLQYEATHDVMTGAWNRGVLLERLGQHIHLALRHSQSMAFAICDLDHFKGVNDTHGHQAGDQVLVRFVQLLRDAVRETDVVGRYGGEEFAVVFPSTTVRGAAEAMERARVLLARTEFTDSSENLFRVTATFGVAGVLPGCGVRNVVAWADAALYEGKEAGRDRVVVAPPEEGNWM